MATSGEEVEESHESSSDESVEETSRKQRENVPKRHRSMFIDNVAEEDDDEEEEGRGHRARKKAKPSVTKYFDEEASVDDDEEDPTDDENEIDQGFFVDNELTNEEVEPDNARRQRLRQFILGDQEEDLEKMVQQFKDRHRLNQYGSDEEEEVDQQALLPSVRDPKLWLVKCVVGHERATSVCLMQKVLDMPELQILSVTALDNLKGYIYIEAEKQAYVKEACKGMHNIYYWAPVKMVPIQEMSSVMYVERKTVNFAKGSWVRMKLGIYKGDLGQVVDVDDVRNKVIVKLIPRINLRAIANKLSGVDIGKRQTFAPPQRLFKIQEASNFGIRVERRKNIDTGEYYDCVDNIQFKDGFLYKTTSMKSVIFQKIQPTIDEIEKFQETDSTADVSDMVSLFAKEKKVKFVQGDAIVVASGDLKNLMGWVEKVEGDFVYIRPQRTDLPRSISINEKDLCKHFKVGQHVKVVSGVQEGITGMVLKVEGRVLVLLSDTTKKDIRVFADYVVENYVNSTEIMGSEDSKLQTPGRAHIGPQIKGRRQQNNPLIGRCIKIRAGSYKGYRGHVKEIKGGSMVRVELESQMKIVYVKRDDIVEISNPATPFGGTPVRNGNQTPLHQSQSPLRPFYTPTRDPRATPIHSNMRTPVANRAWAPMSPSATPLDSMRRPIRDQAWCRLSPKGTPVH